MKLGRREFQTDPHTTVETIHVTENVENERELNLARNTSNLLVQQCHPL